MTAGSIPHTASVIVDDTSIIIAYSDLPYYFIHQCQEFGKPLQYRHLSQFTQTENSHFNSYWPIASPLSPQDHFHLQSTIDYLKESSGSQTSPKITTGARFLGFPIGSATFANEYNTTKSSFDTFNTDLSKLISRVHDLQTQAQRFRLCAIPSITFHLAADVFRKMLTKVIYLMYIHEWQSTSTSKIDPSHRSFRPQPTLPVA